MKIVGLLIIFSLVFSGVACDQKPKVSSSSTGLMPERKYNPAVLTQGERVYKTHCAGCHGSSGEGHPQWRKVGDDGNYPPPPLDGSGHAWHHSIIILKNVIKHGSPPEQGNMPAWQDKLSNEEIDAVINYIQSLWSDQVYATWYEMQQQAK